MSAFINRVTDSRIGFARYDEISSRLANRWAPLFDVRNLTDRQADYTTLTRFQIEECESSWTLTLCAIKRRIGVELAVALFDAGHRSQFCARRLRDNSDARTCTRIH
jgi:hypothetical protein